MSDFQPSQDYIEGYKAGLISGNVYTHSRVMKILMFVQKELDDVAKIAPTDGVLDKYLEE